MIRNLRLKPEAIEESASSTGPARKMANGYDSGPATAKTQIHTLFLPTPFSLPISGCEHCNKITLRPLAGPHVCTSEKYRVRF